MEYGNWANLSVSIQPKPKNGLRVKYVLVCKMWGIVSIQPKPKNGLREKIHSGYIATSLVSIQPKPKNGLRDIKIQIKKQAFDCFNPAEAEEWFKSRVSKEYLIIKAMFQSSRSRRMV